MICIMCGRQLPEELFKGSYTQGAALDVARINVQCPHCGVEVSITQGIRTELQQDDPRPASDEIIDAEIVEEE